MTQKNLPITTAEWQKPVALRPKQALAELQHRRIKWSIKAFGTGYRITSTLLPDQRYKTLNNNPNTHRIFQIEENGKTKEDQIYYQSQLALQDLLDRIGMVYENK
jgi:hypothetical protein